MDYENPLTENMMTEKLYAIRDVAEMTGVKPVTLRAWQRRYHTSVKAPPCKATGSPNSCPSHNKR